MASPTARNLPALSTADGWLIALMLSLAMVPAILWLAWTLTRYHWARPTGHEQDSPRMSADTVSSLFPDRPIRPLPKRRLRERLSPEVADSIQFPPAPQTVTPLFPYPYPLRDEEPDIGSLSRERAPEVERIARRNGLGIESDEDDAVLRRDLVSLGVTDPPGRLARPPLKTEHGRRANPQLPHSAASSVDGYDLFENSNKKKRKIPTAGDAALNGVHATNDSGIGSGPLSTNTQSGEGHGETPIPTSTPYYGSGSFASGGQNVAGPGRGRYGRPRSGRSPLRPLSDSTNNWAGRNGKLRPGPWGSGASENTGIISTAIANAEKLPPQQGQENMSLLQQQLSAKRSPATTQFTFTCDSQVPGTFAWPGSDRRGGVQTHLPPTGRLADENWSRGPQAAQVSQSAAPPQTADIVPQSSNPITSGQNQAAATQKSSRRSAAKEYMAAAKARRRQTQLYNKRHPPKPEEIWICHFCEYESIFGHPPEALVRQYEIKDRKQRQLEQQRRAQWERMKKGKHKGKKNGKLPAKVNNAAQDPQQPTGTHGAPMNSNYSQGTQSEEYYDDEDYYEDEDYEPEDEIPLEGGVEVAERQDNLPILSGGGGSPPTSGKGGT